MFHILKLNNILTKYYQHWLLILTEYLSNRILRYIILKDVLRLRVGQNCNPHRFKVTIFDM